MRPISVEAIGSPTILKMYSHCTFSGAQVPAPRQPMSQGHVLERAGN